MMKFWRNRRPQRHDRSPARDGAIEVQGVLQEAADILRAVLATYEPEEDFQTALKRVLERRNPGSSHARMPFFTQFMQNYARGQDAGKDAFTIARHILEDLVANDAANSTERLEKSEDL
jgi:hypothetical protein